MTVVEQAFGQYLDLVKAGWRSGVSPFVAAINESGEVALRQSLSMYRRNPMGVAGVYADEFYAPDYGVNLNRVDLPVDVSASFRCGVPNMGSLLAVVANDTFHLTEQLLRNLPQGVTICSLNKIPEHLQASAHEAIAYGTAKGGVNAALNALLLGDGVFIHVAKGVKVDKVVQIVNISNASVPMLSPRRVVVVAEESSEIKVLLCDHSQTSDVMHFNSQLVDVCVSAGAHVELYDIEEGTEATRRYWQLACRQYAESFFSANTTSLHGGCTRNEYRVDVLGDNAETSLSGLSICAGEQIVDNHVTLTHSAKHCRSRQLFKNALFDNSRGGFGGKIIVSENALFTDATQTNRNLLVGEDARMTAAPQLEIYCDEVKCSHGATTGQLDERAVFYMQARGISYDEALRLLTQAFMVDVIDNISFEVLRQRIHVLVEKRLSGASSSCDSCSTSCGSEKNME